MPSFGDYEAYHDDAPPDNRLVDSDVTIFTKNNIMPKTTRKPTIKRVAFNPNKPTLIVVGESMVDPVDVSAIKKIRTKDDLYIIILKSQPNMEFPMWANGEEVAKLLEHFNVVE